MLIEGLWKEFTKTVVVRCFLHKHIFLQLEQIIIVILCGNTGLPLWESLSHKQKTHSNLSSNNCKGTSQKDLIWGKIIFNSVFILSISTRLTQFTNIHNFLKCYITVKNSKWLARLTSYLRFILYYIILFKVCLSLESISVAWRKLSLTNMENENGLHIFIHMPSSLCSMSV